jgi:hypothetical protein
MRVSGDRETRSQTLNYTHRDKGSVQNLVGFVGHRYDRSGDVDLGVINALGIAIDRDGHAQRGGWRTRNGDQPA